MKKTRGQENHIHAILDEIANHRKVPRELAKRVMIIKFKLACEGDDRLREMWAGVDDHTRNFPRPLASAFVDFLYHWQSDNCSTRKTQ